MNKFFYAAFVALICSPAFAWQIDWSRRQSEINKIQNQDQLPIQKSESQELGLIEKILESSEPQQEIVILNTENAKKCKLCSRRIF
jgi:hypothetical protein